MFFQENVWADIDPRLDERVRFSSLHFFASQPGKSDPSDLQLAASPKEWFEQMKDAGITSLRLNHEMRNHPTIHDYKMAWSVDADKAWTVASRNPAEEVYGFWGDQTYLETGERFKLLGFGGGDFLMAQTAPQAASAAISAALSDAIEFCDDANLQTYAAMFRDANDMLNGTSKTVSLLTNHDINPYLLLAPQGILSGVETGILRAFELYNIFGGMGSWNDLSLPDEDAHQERYHLTSKALHKALVEGLVSVANAGVTQ